MLFPYYLSWLPSSNALFTAVHFGTTGAITAEPMYPLVRTRYSALPFILVLLVNFAALHASKPAIYFTDQTSTDYIMFCSALEVTS